MEAFGSIREGVTINIQRSDGRIHHAVVTQLHVASNSVSVEWCERNETKGKEIELEALYALNSALLGPKANQKAPAAAPAENAATINGHGHASNGGGPANNAPSKRSTNRQTNIGGGIPQHNSNNYAAPQQAAPISQPPPQTSRSTMAPRDILNEMDDNNGVKNIKKPAEPWNQKVSDEARRKSNVVKEIEKIKNNREVRRAKQDEKRTVNGNVDTSVPAWEFSQMIDEFRSHIEFQRISSNEPVQDLRISVCVRKRPINKKETSKKDIDVITMPNKDYCLVHLPKLKVDLTKYLDNQKFRFDFSFDEQTSTDLTYKYSAQPLVKTIFDGGNAMCFAYGQTGSGKTFTMGGDFSQKNVDCSKGIYAFTARDVFKHINGKWKGQLDVYCTFFEIYCGKVYDLLNNKKKLRVLEDHKNVVQIVDIREHPLSSVEDVLSLIQYGMNIRTSGATSANQHSSRSHAVFQIILRNKMKKEHGKISLIDLAGSERGKDTNSADRITRMEGAEINKSLLALKECIRALGRRDAHVPFRGSTLTKVLRDSFIGENSRVCMIAMISPGNSDVEHTLNTLRYADRVKELGTEDRGDVADIKMHNDDEQFLEDEEAQFRRHYNDGNGLTDSQEENEEEEYDEEEDNAMNDLQKTLAELQDMEEQVLENHGDLIKESHKWMVEYEKIYEETIKVVDYDREEYAKRLDYVLGQNMAVLANLQNKLGVFKEGLVKEEKISKSIQDPKARKKANPH